LELVAAVAVQPAAAMLASTMFGLAQKQQDKHHDHHCLLVTPKCMASKFEPPRDKKNNSGNIQHGVTSTAIATYDC